MSLQKKSHELVCKSSACRPSTRLQLRQTAFHPCLSVLPRLSRSCDSSALLMHATIQNKMAFREEHQDRDNYGRPTRSPEPYPGAACGTGCAFLDFTGGLTPGFNNMILTEERRKRQRSTSPPYDYHPPPPAGMASQHPLPQPPPQSHRGGGGFPRFRMPATRQRVPAPESVLYLVTRRHFDSYLEDAFPTVRAPSSSILPIREVGLCHHRLPSLTSSLLFASLSTVPGIRRQAAAQ